MRRAGRILGWTAGGLAVLILLVAGGLYALTTSDWLRREVEKRAGVALEREARIGALSVDWGWTTVVRLQDVFIANVPWGEAKALLAADEVAAAVRLRPLLRGEVVLANLRAERPALAIETNAEGETNWSFGEKPAAAAAGEAAAPDERAEVPEIENLDISGGRLLYRDATRGLRLDGTVRSVSGEAEEERRIELSADGEMEGRALSVRFRGGSVLRLRDEERPYPLDLDVTFGETSLSAQGQVVDPLHFKGGALDLSLEGPDWSDVFPLLRIPAPPTPPYTLSMALSRDGDVWHAKRLDGRVGESDIAGEIMIDRSGEKPFVRARLRSEKLDFDDLGPLVGAPPATDEERASAEQKRIAEALEQRDELFPDKELQTDVLRTVDMDVSYEAETVQGEDIPVQSLSARVRVEDGKAAVAPLRLGMANGTVEGEMGLDARQQTPSAEARLTFSALELKSFFQDSQFVQETGGKLSGRIDIAGTGRSLAAIMGASDGNAAMAIQDGSLSGLLIEGAGLDIAEALALLVTEDARVPIRCGGGKFEITDGRLRTERLIVDTTDSVVYVQGWVDLADQTLQLDVDAQAKDFSLVDLKSTIAVEGKLGDPNLSLGRGAPIPFLDLGDQEDVDCDWLISETLSE